MKRILNEFAPALMMLLLALSVSCKQAPTKEPEGYEANATFLVVQQINPSHTNNPYICEYRFEVYNKTDGSIQTVDGHFGVYDTIGKFQINDTVYLKTVFPRKSVIKEVKYDEGRN